MENLTRASEKGLIHGLTKLRIENEKYSDLVVRCGDRKWSVHRAVICSQSKFFEKACDGPFKVGPVAVFNAKYAENTYKEAVDGEVHLDDERLPDMVERLVDYFYTLSYSDNEDPAIAHPPTSQTAGREAGSLIVNARMYSLGDRYDILPLKDLARKRFMADLVTNWASENLLELIDVVYTTTLESDRALRDCIKEMVREHGKKLFEKEDFKDAVKSNGDFALDVATAAYCDQPVVQCSYGNCSKTDDSGLRFCQYHRHNIRYY